jgi:predicted DsbA family dithiol-disulfide isomerase
MRIDFVSDVVCPWCVIGLKGLEEAISAIGDEIEPEIVFHPFELNPDMPPEGEGIADHVRRKYGASPEQSAANRSNIVDRAAEVGFTIGFRPEGRIWNTFDAHRLLHWAGEQGASAQHRLKMALFSAYFTDGQNVADHAALLDAVEAAGLDRAAAAEVLAGDGFAEEVRGEENYWRREGINAVPAVIINGKYMISGGHPAASFEKALRRIAAEG